MPPEPSPAAPIFVGGTGRSGTSITGELIGSRADVAFIPIELRFHVDAGGLSDLAAGNVTVDEFAQRLRRAWFQRPASAAGPRGLVVIATRPQMRQALRRLRERHPDDPWDASARFMDEVIQPLCERTGASTWVEMTPPNAHRMDSLCRMFPRARIVHMIRDGRDVASSVAKRKWGPNDFDTALQWWAEHLVKIHEASTGADPDRVITVRLESLVGPRRDEEYDRLVDFLGRPRDGAMDAFFAQRMSDESSHRERWRNDLDEAEQRNVTAKYEEQLEWLEAQGVTIPVAD